MDFGQEIRQHVTRYEGVGETPEQTPGCSERPPLAASDGGEATATAG